MKLALGTVQFGLNYGISNDGGQVSYAEVGKILTTAHDNDIVTIDTACAYGTSKKVLGEILPNQHLDFNIIDKVPDLETHGISIEQTVQQSLETLHLTQLDGLLLHNAADLTDEVYAQLDELKKQGLVGKIGISVYHPAQAFDLTNRFALDLIQLPVNLFDQRFNQTGCLDHLKQQGLEIHARSLFLQGLLLMPNSKVPAYFAPYTELFSKLNGVCKKLEISRQVAALSITHQMGQVDKFVIGVCSHEQLEQVITAYEQAREVKFDIAQFSCHEEALISPFLWPEKIKK